METFESRNEFFTEKNLPPVKDTPEERAAFLGCKTPPNKNKNE